MAFAAHTGIASKMDIEYYSADLRGFDIYRDFICRGNFQLLFRDDSKGIGNAGAGDRQFF